MLPPHLKCHSPIIPDTDMARAGHLKYSNGCLEVKDSASELWDSLDMFMLDLCLGLRIGEGIWKTRDSQF